MHIDILTLFPQMVESFFTSSIMARAVERGLVSYRIINFRDFATDSHRTCDDIPYGGGAGMVLKCEPLFAALDSIGARDKRVVFPSPSGRLFNQAYAEDLSREENLVFICGHYEGLDQRVIDTYVDDEISIGDYVLSSGETSTVVIIDALYRLIDGVISSERVFLHNYWNILNIPGLKGIAQNPYLVYCCLVITKGLLPGVFSVSSKKRC